ncbi:GTP pyrophosphokinase family protein [Cellulomonas sp. PS-H5]|uniref:GTP pyrophosphokinase n=1 Tax=Cellulomonas sp. PS-H5 TaxID=2820400 RepID=UPI001C4EF611|nr:GTP pyrophosphokinase family protein [Cellulomonas sp. PS-H5]MBW0254194.1 GTP pyrophosphokinase family protein [Cellulomonas sp. PS-H5]
MHATLTVPSAVAPTALDSLPTVPGRVPAPAAVAAAVAVAVGAAVDTDRLLRDHRHALAHLLLGIAGLRDQVRGGRDDPVEHMTWRLKSAASIEAKARRKGIPLDDDALRGGLQDLAGLRVVCAFLSDVREVRDAVLALPGLVLLEERDYATRPKASGYRSLHLVVGVPVRGAGHVTVEIQLRTVAMDFWACLEHRLAYRHHAPAPVTVSATLRRAAAVTNALDLALDRLWSRTADAAAAPALGSSRAA